MKQNSKMLVQELKPNMYDNKTSDQFHSSFRFLKIKTVYKYDRSRATFYIALNQDIVNIDIQLL